MIKKKRQNAFLRGLKQIAYYGEKKCNRCHIWKTYDNFYRYPKNNKLCHYCRVCKNIYSVENKKKPKNVEKEKIRRALQKKLNPDKIKNYQLKYRVKHREKIRERSRNFQKKYIDNISDNYILSILNSSGKLFDNKNNVPSDFLEFYRLLLKFKRAIRGKINEKCSTTS